MNAGHVAAWVAAHPLSPIHVDCATAVMLKIIDGKCKMRQTEKPLMARFYDAVNSQPGQVPETTVHELIAVARDDPSEDMQMRVYEQRMLAETASSRPVMKGFKVMIRSEGLLDGIGTEDDRR